MKTLAALFFLAVTLSAMAGKAPPPPGTNWVEARDKEDRSLSFFKFDNLTTNEHLNFLCTDIPKTVALNLRNIKTIKVSENRLLPQFNDSIFDVVTYTSSEVSDILSAGKTNLTLSNSISNSISNSLSNFLSSTGLSNQPASLSNNLVNLSNNSAASNTNAVKANQKKANESAEERRSGKKPKPAVTASAPSAAAGSTNSNAVIKPAYRDVITNSRLAFIRTNITAGVIKDISVKLFKSNTVNWHVGSSNLPPEAANRIVMSNTFYPQFPDVYFLIETNNYLRRLTLDNSLGQGSSITFADAISRMSGDYVLYGEFTPGKLNRVLLRAYLCDRRLISVEKIFEIDADSEELYEAVADLPQLIAAKIRETNAVRGMTFESTPPGAYVYLDDQFLGVTPFVTPVFAAGEYLLRTWNPSGGLDYEKTFPDEVSKRGFVFSNQTPVKIIVSAAESNRIWNFIYKPSPDSGSYSMKVLGRTNAHVWVNGILTAAATNEFGAVLSQGKYYVQVGAPGCNEKKITLEIRSNVTTKVQLTLTDEKKDGSRSVRNWRRSMKIFGFLGLSAGGGAIYYMVKTGQINDQRSAFWAPSFAIVNYTDTQKRILKDYDQSLQYQRIFGWGSLGLLTASTFSYVVSVKKSVIQVSTSIKPGKGVSIQFENHF